MYLLPAAARSNTKWGLSGAHLRRRAGLGYSILPAMADRTPYYTNGGGTLIRPKTIIPTTTVAKAPVSNLVYAKENPIVAPKPQPIILPSPIPRLPLPVLPKPPAPVPVTAAGTPVPSNFPKNQFYVANDGSVWEYSSSAGWFNTGKPYSPPGATPTTTAITPAPSAGSSGAVVAPSTPVNVSVTPDTGYQAILDWLTQDSLLGTFGISGIPNWLTGGVGFLLGYKLVSAKGGR